MYRDTTALWEQIIFNPNQQYGTDFFWTFSSTVPIRLTSYSTNSPWEKPTFTLTWENAFDLNDERIDTSYVLKVKADITNQAGSVIVETEVKVYVFSEVYTRIENNVEVERKRYWATSTIPNTNADGTMRKGGAKHKLYSFL